jgi:erythromycin esterase
MYESMARTCRLIFPLVAALASSCAQRAATPLAAPPAPLPARTLGQGLHGVVRDARGAPVAEALVAANGPGDASPVLARSGPDGEFVIQPLPEGEYGVTGAAKGLSGAFRGDVRVTAGASTSLDLVVGGDGLVLTGTVTDLRGRRIPSAQVQLARASHERGDMWITTTDANGSYEVTLPPADYMVTAKADGYLSQRRFAARGAKPPVIDVSMEPTDASVFAGPEVIGQLRAATVALETCDPTAPRLDDLAPMADVLGKARIVGLGEGAHGGHEMFQLKHRLFRFLVERLGFSVLGIEASWSDTLAINDYLSTGRGDPRRLVSGMRFWVWDTDEVVALVQWMRSYNADARHARKLQFAGFDMQYAPSAVAAVLTYLSTVDSAQAARSASALAGLADEFDAEHFAHWPERARAAATEEVDRLAAHLDEHKTAFVQRSGLARWTVARQSVESLSQFVRLGSVTDFVRYGAMRDRFMAKNIRWILDQQPAGARMALWAANGHVAKHDLGQSALSMGSLLKEAFGDEYVVAGTLFRAGSFRAHGMRPTRGLMEFELSPPPPGTVEGTLSRIGAGLLCLNLRALPAESEAARWAHYALRMRNIGAAHAAAHGQHFVAARLDELYDMVFLIDKLTPSHYLGPVAHPMAPLLAPANLDFEQEDGDQPTYWEMPQLGTNAGYTMKLDAARVFAGAHDAQLSPTGAMRMAGYGAIEQLVDAAPYRGKRVRLSAAVRVESPRREGQAELFLQTENDFANIIGFRGMMEAPIRSQGWTTYEVVLDVARTASTLRYGITASRPARVWIDQVAIEVIREAPPAASN